MFLGYLNLPNVMTLTGLTVSILACVLSLKEDYLGLSLICLMFAGILDLFDGFIARKIQRSKDEALFGMQIDTISDMACFGVVPVIISMHTGLIGFVDFLLQAFYVCCAAMRLGYFNVHGMTSKGKNRYFTGLPVTYAALIFPLVFATVGVCSQLISNYIIRITFLVVGFLFVLKIKIYKPQGVAYIIFPFIAILLSFFFVSRS